MALCQDPKLTYLNSLGFNVVRLPRTGLGPLEVLGREGDGPPEQLGLLPTVWQSRIAVPDVTDDDAADIRGQSTSNIKLEFGLKILEGIVGAMVGGALPKLGVQYSRARSLKFQFKDPRIKKIDPLRIGNYLAQGDLNTENPTVRHFMLEDDASAYVVTEVLLSQSLRVTALENAETGVDLDVPAVQTAVGGQVQVKAIGEDQSDLVYEGTKLLAFGYKAQEIVWNGDRWDIRRLDVDAHGALMSVTEATQIAGPVLFRGTEFLGPAARGGLSQLSRT